ncbi:MAG: hypothetical protein LBB43_00715, partial [Spirochaetaceae bacterium]|nr:hypothetical protein [Spirochaetaceae bacterium]
MLEVDFWESGSHSKAKPEGIQGAKICWGLFDAAPETPEGLPHSVFATRTPHTLEFSEDERG